MTSQERDKSTKRMLWIIPAMIPCIIGDYCMGLEPKDSTAVSFMISTGWLTIADWRIAYWRTDRYCIIHDRRFAFHSVSELEADSVQ